MHILFSVNYNMNSYSNPPPLWRGTSVHLGQKIRADFGRIVLHDYYSPNLKVSANIKHICSYVEKKDPKSRNRICDAV